MEEYKNEQFDPSKKKKKKYVDMNLPGFSLGVRVPGNTDRDIEMALRKFKRMIKDSGILEEVRARQEFLKPSVVKRKMKLEAIRRNNSDYYQDEYQ